MKFKYKKVIIDLGCGTDRIRKKLNDPRFNILSFDHIAINENA